VVCPSVTAVEEGGVVACGGSASEAVLVSVVVLSNDVFNDKFPTDEITVIVHNPFVYASASQLMRYFFDYFR